MHPAVAAATAGAPDLAAGAARLACAGELSAAGAACCTLSCRVPLSTGRWWRS